VTAPLQAIVVVDVVDVVVVVVVVGAVVFLARRFKGTSTMKAAPVVVGDALSRGLKKAQQKKKQR
jgi:hypothetical protein